nr:mitochondrial intermembrane space import and assembly protein 40-B-like isoform X2 [Pseudochaenichthys georgianus]XP_033939538.1 mitochondrial intermembrane space import and assembly protein 40-B-like isoform X3 [Pseudochaenichthys georgianus]
MSSVRDEGKDRIIFVTKEDHATPSSAELVEEDPDDPYEERGLILPSGEINWNCPCLGGMASGPCGTEFKDAFSCFHYSKEEVKGSECLEHFRAMQECIQRYPELYPQEDDKVQKEQSSETEPTSQDSASAETPGADSTSAETPGADSTSATEPDSDSMPPNTEGSGDS